MFMLINVMLIETMYIKRFDCQFRNPETTPVKKKMITTASVEQVKKSSPGSAYKAIINDDEELDYRKIVAKASQKK